MFVLYNELAMMVMMMMLMLLTMRLTTMTLIKSMVVRMTIVMMMKMTMKKFATECMSLPSVVLGRILDQSTANEPHGIPAIRNRGENPPSPRRSTSPYTSATL